MTVIENVKAIVGGVKEGGCIPPVIIIDIKL